MEVRRVALLGRHPLWLEAVTEIVRTLDAEVVAAGTAFDEVLPRLLVHPPDVLLIEDHLDVTRTDMVTVLRRVREKQPMTTVVVVSGDDPETIGHALAAGAFACVLRTAEPADLAAALRQAFARSFYLMGSPTRGSVHRSQRDERSLLTSRERDVLELAGSGCSNLEIAEALALRVSTVKAHLSRAYEKLGARNRTEAIVEARRRGLLGSARQSGLEAAASQY